MHPPPRLWLRWQSTPRSGSLRHHVGEPKAVAGNGLPHADADLSVEHRPGEAERVKLSSLPARIDYARQLGQQFSIESAPGKAGAELPGIDAAQDGAQAVSQHGTREVRRFPRRAPQRKQRLNARIA